MYDSLNSVDDQSKCLAASTRDPNGRLRLVGSTEVPVMK